MLTIHHVSAPTRFAFPVLPTDQTDTNALTDFPAQYSRAQRLDSTNHLMPGNARQGQARVRAGDRGRIGVTDAACFHPNPNLTRSGIRHGPFHNSKRARCGHLHGLVCSAHSLMSPIFVASRLNARPVSLTSMAH